MVLHARNEEEPEENPRNGGSLQVLNATIPPQRDITARSSLAVFFCTPLRYPFDGCSTVSQVMGVSMVSSVNLGDEGHQRQHALF